LELTPSVLKLDWVDVEKRIERFIKNYVGNSGVSGIVLGMSGGIDSSTVAALSAKAIGGDKVLGIMLPEKETHKSKDIEDAQFVADRFGIKALRLDITSPLEELYNAIPDFDHKDKLCKGNIKARTRMIALYYHANKLGKLICGSSDKSETMMGYFTKWGDAAADIAPIMDLYKTQVRNLARHLGFPEELAAKPSTPALWQNQLAETELGIKYEKLDLILFGLERFMSTQEIASQIDIEEKQVQEIKAKWLSVEHKRRMPLTIKIGYRTVSADFRLPYNSY
jgi:NAD+ synthase